MVSSITCSGRYLKKRTNQSKRAYTRAPPTLPLHYWGDTQSKSPRGIFSHFEHLHTGPALTEAARWEGSTYRRHAPCPYSLSWRWRTMQVICLESISLSTKSNFVLVHRHLKRQIFVLSQSRTASATPIRLKTSRHDPQLLCTTLQKYVKLSKTSKSLPHT